MKKIIFLLIVYSCSDSKYQDKNHQSHRELATLEKNEPDGSYQLVFSEIKANAVLLDEKIELRDNALNIIEVVSGMNGKIVDVVAVSDSLLNYSKEICDAFWYVKIKISDSIYVVNGRFVYRIQDSKQDTGIAIDGNSVDILTTNFFGMGVEYRGDLMGCPVQQPIVIKDTKRNYFGLVRVIPNKYSEKAIKSSGFPYFELRDDDGAYERIDSIMADGTKIRLKIHRSFQEGENDYEVILNFENNTYTAEYISFGEIIYE